MSNRVVIYHANCNDGFCAAYLFWRFDPDSTFIPAQYGDPPPDGLEGKDVRIVDFSYKREILEEINSKAASLVVLDHHKTAQAELEGLPYCTFDMSKCGAMLTLEFLEGVYFKFSPANIEFVNYIQDRDLWEWEKEGSREFSAGLSAYPRDFETWHEFTDWKGQAKLKDQGRAILRYQDTIVQGAAMNAGEVSLAGHCVLCTNSTTLISEIAGELANGRPFGVCWFEKSNGDRVFSLRSREGGIDVSEIAQMFGGGGHAAAAGFTVPYRELLEGFRPFHRANGDSVDRIRFLGPIFKPDYI